MNNLKFLMLLFSAMLLLGSCSDDDKLETPADADDNFITEFKLTLGDKSYEARIDENNIIISVPYTINLDDAVATVVYTSSAKILPDPASITKWENEQIFHVTSYNGDVNEYSYKVIKEEIKAEGDVELKTLADITAFSEAGTSVVNGNLIIGTDDGEDITSIEGLKNLKEITNNLILKNSFKATDLTGLEKLTTLGGLVVGSAETVSTADLNLVTMISLTEITGDIIIRNNSLKWLRLESLQKIGGKVIVASTALESIELPALTEVVGDFDLCGITEITYDDYKNVNMGGVMAVLSLPELSKVGGVMSINYFAMLTEISMPKLTTAGGVEISTLNHQFDKIDLSALITVENSLKIESVRTAGKFASDAANNTALKSLGDLSRLQSVGDSLKIAKFSGMTTLPTFSALKSVRVFFISYAEKVTNDLDLSSVTFPENGVLEVQEFCSIPSIIGKGDMSGDMKISTSGASSAAPNIKGFTSVKNLYINIASGTNFDKTATMTYDFERINGNVELNYRISMTGKNTISFPNLKEISGGFVMTQPVTMRLKKLSLPLLQTIGGQLCIITPVEEYEMPELTTVGCAANAELLMSERTGSQLKVTTYGMLDVALQTATQFELKSLQRVGGKNGLYLNCNATKVTTISLPVLTTVDEKFWVFGATSSNKNNFVTSILVPKLEQAKSVAIERLSNLSDFSSFETVIKNGSVTEENWIVGDCAFEPTYEQMKNGISSQQ